MSGITPQFENVSSLQPRTLTATTIAVLIVATLTPLSVAVGTLPLALTLGGPSLVLMFVASGLLLGLFCVGYTQMIRRITRPGAFYNYISRGLGRPAGVSAALMGLAVYGILQIAVYAVQAVVTVEILATFGISASWQVCFVAQLVVVTFFAYRRIDLSVKVTLIVVILEILMLIVLAGAIMVEQGMAAFPLDAISPDVLGQGQWTVAFVFAILCFGGIEAAALYAPEAKNPSRSVPRGLYMGLVALTVSFALTTWILIGAAGTEGIEATLAENPAGYVFDLTESYLGLSGVYVLSILVLLAQVACTLASTNFTVRYISSLANEGLLPRSLGRNNRHGSPGRATIILTSTILVAVLGLASLGVAPYEQLSSIGFGLSALGSTVLQILASMAVVFYFLKLPATERHWWKTALAPALSALLLIAALGVEIASFSYITGSDVPWMSLIPWIIPILLIAGLLFGWWLRARRTDIYDHLAVGDTAEEAAELQGKRDALRRRELSGAEGEKEQSVGAVAPPAMANED